MKTSYPRLTTPILVSLAALTAGLAQEPPPSPAPPVLSQSAAVDPDLQIRRELELAQAEQVRAHVEQVQAQAARQLAQADQAMLLAQADAMVPEPPEPGAAPRPAKAIRPRIKAVGRSSAPKPLVIRTSATDAQAQSNLEEDLSVMTRILQKSATREFGDEEGPQAMGIPLVFAQGGGGLRSLYIEGAGAVFLLKVRFPLVPPTAESEQARTKSPTHSTWEDTKRELYGPNDEWDMNKWLKMQPGREKPQPYDAGKVERLQRALLEALKSAANIRNLGASESVTVCVFGGPSARRVYVRTGLAGSEDSELAVETDADTVVTVGSGLAHSGESPQTVLTLRASKTDVDAFASGQLDPDAFGKRARITTYTTEGGGWGGSQIVF